MDYSKEKFPLNNFVFYAKGWLVSTTRIKSDEDFLNFIQKILYLDGYGSLEYKDNSYGVGVIVNRFSEYNEWLAKEKPHRHVTIARFCQMVEECAKRYEVSTEVAMVYAIRNFLYEASAGEICLEAPTYSRKLFKMGVTSGWGERNLTYTDMNWTVRHYLEKSHIQQPERA